MIAWVIISIVVLVTSAAAGLLIPAMLSAAALVIWILFGLGRVAAGRA